MARGKTEALLCEGEPRRKCGADLFLRVEPVCCGEVVTGLCVCVLLEDLAAAASPCHCRDRVGWSDEDPVGPRGRLGLRW